MLGFALAADAPDTWQSFALVLTARLEVRERATIATMVCDTLPDDTLHEVMSAIGRGAGFPAVPFNDVLREADIWAAAASDAELRAYLLTAFHTLGLRDRREFLEHANRRATA